MIDRRRRMDRWGWLGVSLALPLVLLFLNPGVARCGTLELEAFGHPIPSVAYGLSGSFNLIPTNLFSLEVLSGALTEDASPADAVTAVSTAGKPALFSDSVSLHKAIGWTTASLFMAAGVVGAVRAYSLMSAGHEYRNSLGITEETMGSTCSEKIVELWESGGGQALRWTHVGLLVAGESLYFANAVTGLGMSAGNDGPGLSRSDIHRYAFYIHASLMVAEVALGFLTSSALSRGDHELISEVLGPAHVAVGFAIPAVIATAGALMQTGAFSTD